MWHDIFPGLFGGGASFCTPQRELRVLQLALASLWKNNVWETVPQTSVIPRGGQSWLVAKLGPQPRENLTSQILPTYLSHALRAVWRNKSCSSVSRVLRWVQGDPSSIASWKQIPQFSSERIDCGQVSAHFPGSPGWEESGEPLF